MKNRTQLREFTAIGAVLMAVLAAGLVLAGCASMLPSPNYYNLGDVSEESCAIIDALGGSVGGGDYPVSALINIDGQGSLMQWPENRGLLGSGKALVRVTPGNHTFTMNFVYEGKNIPVSITYDCKAGMAYTFMLEAKNVAGGALLNPIEATLFIYENTIDENGNFGGPYSGLSGIKIVDKKTETFHQEALKLQ